MVGMGESQNHREVYVKANMVEMGESQNHRKVYFKANRLYSTPNSVLNNSFPTPIVQ